MKVSFNIFMVCIIMISLAIQTLGTSNVLLVPLNTYTHTCTYVYVHVYVYLDFL